MKVLVVGDVIGRPGRNCVKKVLPGIRDALSVDLVVLNGENSAGGFGITPKVAEELFSYGVDVITTGNHIWDKKEINDYLCHEPRVLRPHNFPGDSAPGKGWHILDAANGLKAGVINLSGRVFLQCLECPFRTAERLIQDIYNHTQVIIVDFHAEATAEKVAFGWFMDGKVSAVVGTHTHVQTADERILPGETAYITDIGMVGPIDSVIGVEKEIIIEKFLTQLPARFKVAGGPVSFDAVFIDIDEATGRARSIERIQEVVDDD